MATPYKEQVLSQIDELDEVARKIDITLFDPTLFYMLSPPKEEGEK